MTTDDIVNLIKLLCPPLDCIIYQSSTVFTLKHTRSHWSIDILLDQKLSNYIKAIVALQMRHYRHWAFRHL